MRDQPDRIFVARDEEYNQFESERMNPDDVEYTCVDKVKDLINECAQPTLCTDSDQLKDLTPEETVAAVHHHVKGLLAGQLQIFMQANQEMLKESFDAGFSAKFAVDRETA